MPSASALAMALGIFAIGINLLLTSLVCNEIAVIWNELDSEITEIRGVITTASETLEETNRHKRHSHFALDGESTMRSARIIRRRLLKKLRNKHTPWASTYYPIEDDFRADPFRRPEKCNCQSFKNKCPAGPQGEKGKNGSPGLDGPDGVDGSPGISEPDQYRENRPIKCLMCPPGPAGLPGEIGPVGPTGVEGPAGSDGAPGKDGLVQRGPVGPPGEPGPDGPEGQIGLIGIEGGPAEIATPALGEKGPPGPPGGMGPQGDQGNQGPPGPSSAIIGERGRQGPPGRPGRLGSPGPVGIPGPVGEQECECFVYVNEAPKRGYIPIDASKGYEIRRAPQTPEALPQPGNVPVASQITVQKKGELVTPIERKTLYNYTQSGIVNIAQAKPPKTPAPDLHRGPPLPAWKSASTTEEPQRYRYVTDKEYAAAIPANIFAKRNRIQGTSFVAPARAFAIENDLISIQKPKKLGNDDTKTVVLEKVAQEIINKKKHRTHGTRTLTPKRNGMPLSQANRIGAHLVRSRRKHPPSGDKSKNSKKLL